MLLEVKDLNISLTSEKSVAEHISFRLGQGEMLSIVGSSGAGKTTICKAIMGLLGNTYRADGEILFQAENLLNLPERKRQAIYGKEICLIMQNPMTAFNPSIRVGRQMEKTYLLHHGKTPRQEMQRLFAAILQKLGLEDTQRILNSYPFALSGGMRQRVMIAMAMIARPKLLICDEPTTALDVTIQAQVLDLMNELKAETGMSIIFVTHDLGVISEMADRVLIMYGGRVCEEANVDELFTQPRHPYTIGLIDSHPNPDYHGDRLKVIPGSVPTLKDMPAGCPFHNRCAYAQDRCRDVFPDKENVNAGHSVSCHCWKQTPEGEVE